MYIKFTKKHPLQVEYFQSSLIHITNQAFLQNLTKNKFNFCF